MGPSVQTHIHPLWLREVLMETDGGINELCLQWISCISEIMAQDCSGTTPEPASRQIGVGLIVCLSGM